MGAYKVKGEDLPFKRKTKLFIRSSFNWLKSIIHANNYVTGPFYMSFILHVHVHIQSHACVQCTCTYMLAEELYDDVAGVHV